MDNDGDIDDDDRKALDALTQETVEVEGTTEARKLVESARPVTVVDTAQARERTADLGEVLSRVKGIQVRRSGGLGTESRFSLNGLYDEQIRFFLDGIPIELSGWDGRVADVPVDLIDRVEVHRGVVPIALAADALGGAVDLISHTSWANHASASYQIGSFGTHRAALNARARDADTGAAVGVTFSLDRAANDYKVSVEVPDLGGGVTPARVPRFHDAYQAIGGAVEAGIIDRGWLRRAIVRGYASKLAKEMQHNSIMTIPYGAADYGIRKEGAHVDIDARPGAWAIRLAGGAGRRRLNFRDTSRVIYNWYGEPMGERAEGQGELGDASNAVYRETSAFVRLVAERKLDARNTLRFAVGPSLAKRSAHSLLPWNEATRDPLEARRDSRRLISGVEHELQLPHGIENLAFVKHYVLWTLADDVLGTGQFVPIDDVYTRFGAGDAVRWRATKELWLKASYEYSTRLPSVDEMFGDGIEIQANLALLPEVSHNANLGVRVEQSGAFGELALELDGFVRFTDQLILPSGRNRDVRYSNVYGVRVVGSDAGVSYKLPGGWASVEGSGTLQDIRNTSSDGLYGQFEGDRIPNRPWLLGSLSLTIETGGLVVPADRGSVFGTTRYVHDFFLGWESLGRQESKTRIPSQLTSSVGASYAMGGAQRFVVTFEIQNVTGAQVYDSFGVERPGRALYLKLSSEL